MYGRGGRRGGGGGRGSGRRGGAPSPRGRQGPGRGGGGQTSSVSAAPPPTQRRSEAGSSSTAPASVGQPISEELQTLSLQTQTPVVTPVAPADQKPLGSTPTKVASLPERPGLGTVGEKCMIRANHFLVELDDHDMYHSQVSLELISRGVRHTHDTIQSLNIVLRESLKKSHTVVRRSLFELDCEKQTIGNGLEYWKGFYQSIRPTQMGLSLNTDVSITPFYEPISVIDFVSKLLNIPLGDTKPLSYSDITKVRKALEGVKVKVSYGVKRSYEIIGLTSLPTNELTFHTEDKAEKSVVEYFLEKYQKTLHFCDWPALLSGNKSGPIFLPMEVTALSRKPKEREADIKEIAERNNYGNDDLAKKLGVNVKKELTSIESRLLPAPLLKYHDSGVKKTLKPREGRWNMINAKLFNGATVNSWTCVNFSSLSEVQANVFCGDLVNMCRDRGMVISPTPVLATQSHFPNSIEIALGDIHRMCIAKGTPLQLLIVVLPDFTGKSYGRIKRVCETELGIVSQCCRPRHARKHSRQYLENVALKINVKAGGSNFMMDDVLCERFLNDRGTIIFGADVTHPNPGDNSSPSISAVVASTNWPMVTTYRGVVSAQQHREEIIHDCFAMVREQLEAFIKESHVFPQRIIFYRDGVGEGEFSEVLLHEIEAIKKACESVGLNQTYITFVVVQKRHHTRFFPTNSSQTDRGNVLPGTVVDTKICHPSEFDFYLCSHAGILGTSRPTHYHVLYDENDFTADTLQTLTNNLCYTYARCTSSVSVVPPVHYAHLAAFRARYYIEGYEERGGGVPGMRKEAGPVRPLPAIKENVKKVMFYC